MLSEATFKGLATVFERRVWTQAANTDAPQTAVIFLDAELYIDRVQAPAVMREEWPHALAVYISNHGAAARHADYTCHPEYAKFIVEDVLPWVTQLYPTLDPAKTILAGLSLSGLAAADIARRYPDRFCKVICQSPSFWWENERFRSMIPPKPAHAPAYWICVGNQETQSGVTHPPTGLQQDTTQIEACERARDVFNEQGYRVSYRMYDGGHDPACWQTDLALALQWAAPH